MSKRFIGARQTTLAREVELCGAGVHSGAPVTVVLHPAPADSGYRFLVRRRDRIVADIPAAAHAVRNLTLCTVIGDDAGVTIGTVEHLLAALRGLGIDNCYIEIDNREVPIMDGSAAPFVLAIENAGTRELSEPRKFIKVLRTVSVRDGDCYGELAPGNGFNLDVEIDFPSHLIGRQRLALDLTAHSFRTELSEARTFGFMRDVEKLWKAGLALGASLDNTIAIDDDKILNPEGLRHPHEFVRHKMLDAVGDLALAGAPILGSFKSVRGGHRLNANVLKALLAGGEGITWRWERAPRVMREAAPIDISAGRLVVNYAADRS